MASNPPSPSSEYTLRTHRPGDIGWIIHRHATYYDKEHDWGLKMEGLAAQVGADFLEHYDPSSDRCWIAERNDEFLGCIILVNDREEGSVRLWYDSVRTLRGNVDMRGFASGRKVFCFLPVDCMPKRDSN
ncbi:unnamed protein product [Penicillium bialowiezense]